MADITLSVALEKGALTKSIQAEINNAKKEKVVIKAVADTKAFAESIQNAFTSRAGNQKTVKINVGINQNTFNQNVKNAINAASNSVKVGLKVNIDENYLRRQLDKALKGQGTSNVGSTGSKSSSGSGSSSNDDELARLKAIEQQTKLTTRGYTELNKVRNALANLPAGSDEAGGLRSNLAALKDLITGYKEGSISAEEYKSKLAEIVGQNAAYIDSAKDAGKYANSFSDKLQKFKMHLTTISSIVRAFRMVAMVVKPVVNAVTEVDTAMTQLKIVTQATDEALQKYANDISTVADRTAGSITDLINSTTTFSRLGYTLEESSRLAEYTQMLENVGDIDEQSATAAMTAIVKAYGFNVEELESIMDRLVTVGNNFPISVKELAEGMNNAGSMLAVATEGNFDQSIALLTAANTTIQNISKSSTGLRTIAARIRNVGTELDDLGESMTEVEYDEIVQALTKYSVSLTDSNGQLRNTYDILYDLSQMWDTLSKNEQAALAKTLSGTRQQNVFISLMSNFNEASGAMTKMAESEGALAKANDVYLDSIKAHTQQLKNAFVDMSKALLSADAAKFFIDLAKNILKAVTAVVKFVGVLGGLRTILIAIATYLVVMKKAAITTAITKLISSVKALSTAVVTFFREFASGAISAQSALGIIGLIATVISMVIGVVSSAVKKYKEHLKDLASAGTEAGDKVSKLSESYQKYIDVSEDSAASSEEMASAQKELRDALGLTSEGLSDLISKYGSYGEAVKRATAEQLALQIATQKTGVEAQKVLAQDNINKGLGRLFSDNGYYLTDYFTDLLGDKYDFATNVDFFVANIDKIKSRLAEISEDPTASKSELDFLLNYYSIMSNGVEEYAESVKQLNDSIVYESMFKLDNAIPKTRDEFKKYRDELINTTAQSRNFASGIDNTADRLDAAAVAVDNYLSNSSGFYDFYISAETAAAGAVTFAKGLQGIEEVANGTSEAVSRLDEILKGEDYDTGLEKRVDYFDKLIEEVEGENWGGKHYRALADYFGVDINKSIDDQLAMIENLKRYFDDADQGMYNFLMDINEKVPEAIANFNAETGTLTWDSAELQAFADAMGITRDALVDLLGAYVQHVPPSEWMALTSDEAARWLEQDNVIRSVNDTLVVNRQRFDELAAAAGKDADEMLDSIMQLSDYTGQNVLEINIDTSSVESAVEGIREFSRNTDDVETKVAGIVSALSGLNSDAVGDILLELNLPDDIEQQVVSMLPAEIQETLVLDTAESENQVDAFNESIDAVIKNNDGRTITIRVSDGGTIQSYQNRVSALLSGFGGITATPRARGTRNAKNELALLGDEYSASGQPKPELVISNGRAYLAGINGPVLGRLHSGDVVYTNSETRQILGSNLSESGGIPAYSAGTTSRWWNKISGGAGSLSSSSTYSSYYGTSSGSGSSASSSGSGDNWFEQQYELHNHYRKLDQETDANYLTWLVSAWKQAYAEGIIELKDAHKYEEEAYELMKKIASERFKDEYDTHQHMVAMGKETDQEYYSWLEWRHQTAYANNEITLEEYWKYQEEVYKKAKELVNDYFNDIDHKIDMLENAGKTDQEIIAWDEKGMLYAEERIAELIKEGKDNNDSAVQEQQKKWWSYYKDRQKREEDTTKKAKSAADELIDYRKKMLKKDLDNEKSSLNQRLTTLRDFYSKQKELLRDTYDEDKYLDEQAKKRKAVSDLEIQLAQIEYDNSAWAQKKRLELLQELADAQKDLADFEKEHALQVAQDKLDELQEMQEKELNDQIDAIEKVTESEEELYKKALQDVQNGGQDLYEAMVAYNNQYGTGNSEDIAEMWDEAYTALKKYKGLFDEYYKDIKLTYGNDTTPGVVDTSKIDAGLNPVQPVLESQKPAATVANAQATQPQAQTKATTQTAVKADPVVGTAVVLKSNGKLARSSYDSPSLTPISSVIGKTLYVQAAYPGRAAPYHIGTSTNFNDSSSWVGWVDKHQLVGYATGTRSALAGLHEINERGDEALFKTADGSTYRLFSGGERVFNSSATDFLYNFSNNPAAVLSAILSQIGGGMGEIKNNTLSQNISMGDIYIQGNATEKTISEIRREKRAEMDYMLKELNRLNRQ